MLCKLSCWITGLGGRHGSCAGDERGGSGIGARWGEGWDWDVVGTGMGWHWDRIGCMDIPPPAYPTNPSTLSSSSPPPSFHSFSFTLPLDSKTILKPSHPPTLRHPRIPQKSRMRQEPCSGHSPDVRRSDEIASASL